MVFSDYGVQFQGLRNVLFYHRLRVFAQYLLYLLNTPFIFTIVTFAVFTSSMTEFLKQMTPLFFIFPNRLINTFMAHTGNAAQFSSATYLLRTVIIVWTIMYILSNCTRKGNVLFFVLDVAYIYDLLSPIYTFHYVGRSCV